MDPVFAALGMHDAAPVHGTPPAMRGNPLGADFGYPSSPWSSPAWAAYVQAASLAAASAAMSGQQLGQNAVQGSAQCGSMATVARPNFAPAPLGETALHINMAESVLEEVPLHLLATPTKGHLSSQKDSASPLLLADMFPAESRSTSSGGDSVSEVVSADATPDVAQWPNSVTTLWPAPPWLSPEVSNPMAAADYHEQLLGDSSPMSPGLSTNLFERNLETPPPRASSGRWAFRTDAPCFVPSDMSIESPTASLVRADTPAAGSQTPDKSTLSGTSFVASRAEMLRLRLHVIGKSNQQFSTAGLHTEIVSAAHDSIGSVEKTQSRAQIRALAADARAQFARGDTIVEMSEKGVPSNSPPFASPARSGRRPRGEAVSQALQ